MHTIRAFQKSGHLFRLSKRARETSPLWLSCAPVSVAEYAWKSLYLPKYPWKCLNKLLTMLGLWICMNIVFSKIWKESRVLNKPGFICKGYVEWQICLIIAPYASIMAEYAWIYLNIPQYAWPWRNIAECPEHDWINLPDFASALIMPRYSYSNTTIIVIDVIILGFLPAGFVHPGTLLPFYLSLTRVRTWE